MKQPMVIIVRQRLVEKIDEVFEWGGVTELARQLKDKGIVITQQAISRFILQGKRLPGWLPDAAAILGVTVDWLKGDESYAVLPQRRSGVSDNADRHREIVVQDIIDVYTSASPNVRAVFDAGYPELKKQLKKGERPDIEEVADSGFVPSPHRKTKKTRHG